MSILGGSSSSENVGAPFFHEFKKQASFFFKEKIKTARLALTDVTPAQLLTEEATDGNPWAPDTRTLKIISRAAFEVDDYWRIVEILHKRFARFDEKNWRLSYNTVIVLEHLLTQGPESVAEEFQTDKDVLFEMESFQHIDEKGFNWGLNLRRKSERILKLLQKGPLLKEERDRARKLTRGIEGFGSFSQRTSSGQGIFQDSSSEKYRKCNSQFYNRGNEEDELFSPEDEDLTQTGGESSRESPEGNAFFYAKKTESSDSWNCSGDSQVLENRGARMSFEENMAPKKEVHTGEIKPLLGGQRDESRAVISTEEDHPFSETEHQAAVSLIST